MKTRFAFEVLVRRPDLRDQRTVTMTHYEGRRIPPVGGKWVDYGFTLEEGQFINDNQLDLATEVETCLRHRNTFA